MLKKHFLFRHFDDKMLKIILDNSIGYQIDEDCIIYNENEIGQSFFLIINGKVEITSKNSNNKIILQSGDCFGELALIYPEILRTETAKSITKIEFIVIIGSFYREISKNFSKHSIEQITYFLKGNIWLDYINPVVKLNLASLIQVEEYEKNETVFTKKKI
jgi:CRP-like cAMP-binding protein